MNSNDTLQAEHRSLLPPVYLLMAIVAMVGADYLAPAARWIEWPWTLLGAVPIVVGLGMAALGRYQFHKANTTVFPFERSSRLVSHGVFRLSRNPMYLGMMLVLTGVAIGLGSITPVLALPLFLAIIRQRFVLKEEESLAQQFGPTYHEYTRKVRRWI